MEPSGILEIGVELPKGALDGHMQEFRLHDSSLLAQVAILVQTITSEFLNWTGRCCLYPIAGSAVLLLLAGNCLPYHQPKLLITKDSKKALGLSRFPLRCQVGDAAYTCPWAIPKPTTLVDSQLHQMHLTHPT